MLETISVGWAGEKDGPPLARLIDDLLLRLTGEMRTWAAVPTLKPKRHK